MVFIALGTQNFQLNRLLQEVDLLIKKGQLKDAVFAQIGHSDYRPIHYQYERFLEKKEFDRCIRECDVLISHGGVGTIITAINSGKPVVLYPRLKKFGEHVDDHQLEISQAFSKKEYVLYCSDGDDLLEKIEASKHYQFEKYVSSTGNILNLIDTFLEQIRTNRPKRTS